jgi:hypothetical protein
METIKAKENDRYPTRLSPWSKKTCNNINIALMRSIAKIGPQSAMKIHRSALHEFPTHIPSKPVDDNKSISMYKVLRADTDFITWSESPYHPWHEIDENPP